MRRLLLCWIFFVLCVPLYAEQASEVLRIRNVYIRSRDVFDPAYPEFNTWYFRVANTLHVKTRDSFIRNELLFREGDLLTPDLLRESERNLRRYNFLGEASIKTERVNAEETDVYVYTEDQWTTAFDFSAGKTRGRRRLALGVGEENFLGLGKKLALKYEENYERESLGFLFIDPQFLNTHYRVQLGLTDSSDGYSNAISIIQPFYAESTRWSYGVYLNRERRANHIYYQGTDAAAIDSSRQSTNLFATRAWGERYGRLRLGVTVGFQESLFADEPQIFDPEAAMTEQVQRNLDPEDKRLLSYGLNLNRDWVKRHVRFSYFDRFGRTEDYPIGFYAGVSLARFMDSEGPDSVGGMLTARWSAAPAKSQFMVSRGRLSIRREQEMWNNVIAEWWLHYYVQQGPAQYWFFRSPRQTLAFNLSSIWTREVDAPFQVSLGEDEGLRGYTSKRFNGSSRILFNFEDRIFTTWENRFAGIGVVPFFDAGYVWDAASDAADFGASVGIGLRIGFKKYGRTKILRLDLARPLTGEGGFSLSVASGHVFEVFQ